MKRGLQRVHAWGLVLAVLGTGAIECLFDAYKAGLSWRYMADFGWCVGLAAIVGACALEEWAHEKVIASRANGGQALSLVRGGTAVLVGAGLIIAVLTFLMPGRIDNLMANAPQIFFEIRGWFTGWTAWI
jgi:hypothetical protein